MEIEKIMTKLEELKKNFESLKNIGQKEGEDKIEYYISLLERMIDRIYPDKDAKIMKIKLHYSPNMPQDDSPLIY